MEHAAAVGDAGLRKAFAIRLKNSDDRLKLQPRAGFVLPRCCRGLCACSSGAAQRGPNVHHRSRAPSGGRAPRLTRLSARGAALEYGQDPLRLPHSLRSRRSQRNPRVAGTPANSAKAGPLRRARWSARPYIHRCPWRTAAALACRRWANHQRNPRAAGILRNPRLGRQQPTRRSQPAPKRARSWPRSCALPRGHRPARQAYSTTNRPSTCLPVA
jgi:hypothetical protein